MPDSMVSLRLPAVVWVCCAAAILTGHSAIDGISAASLLTWAVFISGNVYFVLQLVYRLERYAGSAS
jgi:hypothetical protein